jgi:hypothetical protein
MANSWWFQASPKLWNIDAALKELLVQDWKVSERRREICVGDDVYFWRCGSEAALVGTGRIVVTPIRRKVRPEQCKYQIRPAKFAGLLWLTEIEARPLKIPLKRDVLCQEQIVREWSVMKYFAGTNRKVSSEVDAALRTLVANRG